MLFADDIIRDYIAHQRHVLFADDITRDYIAHQRRIREQYKRDMPRDQLPSLEKYTVGPVGELEARRIIEVYEWLGDIGRAGIFIGLFSPQNELLGVACFGPGAGGYPNRIIGEPLFCLERGACVHYAPPNAASYLISRACKFVYKKTGTARFYAYGDPEAGEYGAVYQACNWLYLGQGLVNGDQRRTRTYVLEPGADPKIASNWKTTRVLRAGKRKLNYESAEAQGWTILRRDESGARAAKHLYAINIGQDKRAWRKSVASLPYPKHPALNTL